jgi:hypothetical protein
MIATSALKERWSGRQSGYVTTAPLVFVMNMFSNDLVTSQLPFRQVGS